MKTTRPGRIAVLVNPHSRKNLRRPGRPRRIRRILGTVGEVRETNTLEDLEAVLRETLGGPHAPGCHVADGGDGTLHWLLNTACRVMAGPEGPIGAVRLPMVLPTNSGTIDFVARRAGIHGNAESILKRLVRLQAAGREVSSIEVESLLVEGTQRDDQGRRRSFSRIGFAAALAGVGQRFFDAYYSQPTRGAKAILKIIVRQALSMTFLSPGLARLPFPSGWRAQAETFLAPEALTLRLDGQTVPIERFRAVNVGAFPINLARILRFFGKAGDGRLHVLAGLLTPFEIVANLPNMILGRTIRARQFVDCEARRVEVEAPDPGLRPILDGERLTGVLEARIAAGPRIRIPRLDVP